MDLELTPAQIKNHNNSFNCAYYREGGPLVKLDPSQFILKRETEKAFREKGKALDVSDLNDYFHKRFRNLGFRKFNSEENYTYTDEFKCVEQYVNKDTKKQSMFYYKQQIDLIYNTVFKDVNEDHHYLKHVNHPLAHNYDEHIEEKIKELTSKSINTYLEEQLSTKQN